MALQLSGGVGVLRPVQQMVAPISSSRRRQHVPASNRSAIKVRDALVLQHLPLADAIASAAAHRLFPLV